jgi:hypothetical protein
MNTLARKKIILRSKANTFDNKKIIFEAKKTSLTVSKLFLKRSEHVDIKEFKNRSEANTFIV